MMNNKFLRYVFHCLCYYCAWIGSIYFAKNNNAMGGPIVVSIIAAIQAMVLYKKTPKNIIKFTITLTIIGFLIDSILSYLKLIYLSANPFYPLSAPWMIGLWINFSIIFYDTCQQYFKHYFILGLLALLGFPIAYFTGSKLGAANIQDPTHTLIYLGIIWAITLPSICIIFANNGITNDTHNH